MKITVGEETFLLEGPPNLGRAMTLIEALAERLAAVERIYSERLEKLEAHTRIHDGFVRPLFRWEEVADLKPIDLTGISFVDGEIVISEGPLFDRLWKAFRESQK